MTTPLTVALPKGRLQSAASALFAKGFGVDPAAAFAGSRRLAWDAPEVGLRFLSVRASDVVTYVEQGAADAGLCGLDVLREHDPDLYEPLDLGIGRCRLVLAAPRQMAESFIDSGGTLRNLTPGRPLRVATSYPRIAGAWLARQGVPAETAVLHGAIELAPRQGVADAVVDITETGRTLAQNGLTILADVMEVSTRLAVGRVALKQSPDAVRGLVEGLRAALP